MSDYDKHYADAVAHYQRASKAIVTSHLKGAKDTLKYDSGNVVVQAYHDALKDRLAQFPKEA